MNPKALLAKQKRMTQKQESFCLNLFQGMSQRDAYIAAGYSPKQAPATIDRNACDLANSTKILARWGELKQKAESAAIASVQERKKRLTEYVRADLVDFIGVDGDPTLSKEVPHHTAASEFAVTTRYDKDGQPITRKYIKLRDPIAAIAELNKMERIYTEGGIVNVDIKGNVNVQQISLAAIFQDPEVLKAAIALERAMEDRASLNSGKIESGGMA